MRAICPFTIPSVATADVPIGGYALLNDNDYHMRMVLVLSSIIIMIIIIIIITVLVMRIIFVCVPASLVVSLPIVHCRHQIICAPIFLTLFLFKTI